MKRRDFNRLVLAAGASPVFAKSSLAQMSAEELQNTPAKAASPSIIIKNSPRTYNQVNVPRKYVAGRRRFTIYWTWSYPWEANRDVTELDNRFSTMTEVRRVGWPRYETPEWSEQQFLQGIAGTLELFHLSTVRFQNIVGEATGQPVVVYQRIDQAGQRLPLERTGPRRYRHHDGLRPRSYDHGTGGKRGRNRGGSQISDARGHLSSDRSASRRRRIQRSGGASNGISAPRRSLGSQAATLRPLHALPHEGLGRARGESMGSAPCARAGNPRDCAANGHEGFGRARMAYRRDDLQLSPAPAALRPDD